MRKRDPRPGFARRAAPSRAAEPPDRATLWGARRGRLAPTRAGLVGVLATACLIWMAGGCGRTPNRLDIASFKEGVGPRSFRQKFEEAHFGRRGRESFDIVLQSRQPSRSAPTQSIRQIVHVRTFWRPIPGDTWADDTGVTAAVRYYVLHGDSGMCYEGGGYVDVKLDRKGKRLLGRLGVVHIKPGRHFGPDKDPFGSIQLGGRIKATLNESRTSAVVRRLMRDFGPFEKTDPDSYPAPVR